MRRNIAVILAVIVLALLSNCAAERLKALDSAPDGTKSVVPELFVKGKIIEEPDGYFIQGQMPPEIFRILNPVPERLDSIVKGGATVTIGIYMVQGDNVNIRSIDGKPYTEKKENRTRE